MGVLLACPFCFLDGGGWGWKIEKMQERVGLELFALYIPLNLGASKANPLFMSTSIDHQPVLSEDAWAWLAWLSTLPDRG